MSLNDVKNRLLYIWSDRPLAPGMFFMGTAGRNAADYFGGPGAHAPWFREGTIQALFYTLILDFVAAQRWPYLVLLEQPYPNYPNVERSDIMVVDTTSGQRLAVELKADFDIASATTDMEKLEQLVNQGVLFAGVAVFCCEQDRLGSWLGQLTNFPAAVKAAGIYKAP
jgi:hypothetical protein